MKISLYQEEIIKAIQAQARAPRKQGIIIEALAGCGKSSTIILTCIELKKMRITPKQVAILIFGRKNADDIKLKLGQKIDGWWESSVQTLHSFGFGIYRKALNINKDNKCELIGSKYTDITQIKLPELLQECKSLNKLEKSHAMRTIIELESEFLEVVDMLREYCYEPNSENIESIIKLYSIPIKTDEDEFRFVIKAAELVLKEARRQALEERIIDFTDMAWIPWIEREEPRFARQFENMRNMIKFFFLDECQDSNVLQNNILKLIIDPTKSFLTAVGDRNQAVFFFRGSLSDGMDTIKKEFNGISLDLPVCYRCGTSHLELVRSKFPHIEIQPRPNAPEGEIRAIPHSDLKHVFKNKSLTYIAVSRKKAPLVTTAIQLLAEGLPVKIKDRKLGVKLHKKVQDICRKMKYKYNPKNFILITREYREIQLKYLAQFKNSEELIIDFEDNLLAIQEIFKQHQPKFLKDWKKIVDEIFAKEDESAPIELHTIHSGKGGEGQVSVIIDPYSIPIEFRDQTPEQRLQEDNLLYVALTRCLANGEEGSGIMYIPCISDNLPSWLPDKFCKRMKWDEDAQTFIPCSSFKNTGTNNLKSTQQEEAKEVVHHKEEPKNKDTETRKNKKPVEQVKAEDTGTNLITDSLNEILTEADSLELPVLEAEIISAFGASHRWVKAGKALRRIRDNRLYMATHTDFNSYCQDKFERDRRQIDRWIVGTIALENLASEGIENLPETEGVIRPIACLPVHEQVEIWVQASKDLDKNPTRTEVEEAKRAFFNGEPRRIENRGTKQIKPEDIETGFKSLPLDELERLYSCLRAEIKNRKVLEKSRN